MKNDYDHYFRIYASIYFAGKVDWPWFKAQAIAESSLDPDAVSPKGARGLMQLMPATSAEIAAQLWIDDNPLDPKLGILMGIHHMHRLWSIWKKEQGLERLRFALASYNAGQGNIVRAQRLAGIPTQWNSLAAVLKRVTGASARETVNYVKRVEAIRKEIIEA